MTGSNEASRPPRGVPRGGSFVEFPSSALDGTVVDRFFETADRFADRTAVVSPHATWTYAELADEVRRIGGALAAVLPRAPQRRCRGHRLT